MGNVEGHIPGYFPHGGEEERPSVSTHPAVPCLWAVGSGCCLPVIVLASEGKTAILVWREGGAPRAAPHRAFESPDWWWPVERRPWQPHPG